MRKRTQGLLFAEKLQAWDPGLAPEPGFIMGAGFQHMIFPGLQEKPQPCLIA
ncbi:MAG: hypothetical protein Q7T13_14845 [Polaromonas sp.]|nr:hypothetical protein [Polaromonas sp.]